MQRSIVIAVVGVLGVALAVPVSAGAQAPVQQRTVETVVDPDFCGTGADVSIHNEFRETISEGESSFWVTFNYKTYFTYDGVTLFEQFAGRSKVVSIPPASGAAETFETTETGLRAKLKLPDGGVLTSDHGYLRYRVSVDATGEFVGLELIRENGGHPAWSDDPAVFCQAATTALGIPYSG
jgi:hypothetical protein